MNRTFEDNVKLGCTDSVAINRALEVYRSKREIARDLGFSPQLLSKYEKCNSMRYSDRMRLEELVQKRKEALEKIVTE